MTQEQKAKAYDEALKRAEAAIDIAADKDLVKGVAITIFPELKESEDEKIRKWLYDYISNCPNNNFDFYGGVGKDAVLNYLEKQKEPIEGKGNSEEISSKVDLEKEVSKWWDASFPEPDFKFRKHRAHIVSNDEIIHLAHHFYKLGLNARKAE